jgi:4-hydroxy-tetrahydrodipicolinate reductase
MMIRVIICGILGKMGSRVMEACFEDKNIAVAAGIDVEDGVMANIPIYSSMARCAEQADVVIDFSSPALTGQIVDFCRSSKTALVMCTTGHGDTEAELIRRLSLDVAVFKSANMSLGIALLKSLAKRAAALLRDDFDIEIVERHHNRKLDAPSGTALLLANEINASLGGHYDYVYDRHALRQKRGKREIGIHAVRGGTIVGDHEVIFAGSDELITLSHSAASRAVFAVGAINAARFIAKQPPGLYDMDSVVTGLA